MKRKWLIMGSLALLLFFLPFLVSIFAKGIYTRAFEKKLHAKVTIDTLHLSWLGPQVFQGIHFSNPDMKGTFEEIELHAPLWSSSGPFVLKNGTLLYQNGKAEEINGHVKDHLLKLLGKTDQGYFSIEGAFFSKNHFDLTLDFSNTPTPILDQFFGADHRLTDTIGPLFNLKGTASLQNQNGSLSLALSSPSFQTTLQGNLTPQGFTLRKPLKIQFQLTPQVSQAFLRDVNPLFITGISAKNPISLEIFTNDFFFPLYPFSLEKLRIGKGVLNLGQIECRNGSSLATLISFLKSRLSKTKKMNAWLTPLVFHIQKGILETERMDALLDNSIHICTWGNIDLFHNQLHMYLGLPADTLKQSFGIQNLPSQYVLKIPIRGSTSDPELITTPAATKIAALIASEQLPKKKKIFGNIIKAIAVPEIDKDVPPPQRPFPWER